MSILNVTMIDAHSECPSTPKFSIFSTIVNDHGTPVALAMKPGMRGFLRPHSSGALACVTTFKYAFRGFIRNLTWTAHKSLKLCSSDIRDDFCFSNPENCEMTRNPHKRGAKSTVGHVDGQILATYILLTDGLDVREMSRLILAHLSLDAIYNN